MAYVPPKTIRKLLTNKAYGYPRGEERRKSVTTLQVLHITGNSRTAKMPDGIGTGSGCRAEWSYANRSGSNGPSAHAYVARNGAVIVAINASKHAAWSNGDLINPDTSIPMARRMVKEKAKGFNPNELVFREVEYLGAPGSLKLTPEQRETAAYLIARDSLATGLPIKAGVTVGLHAHINTVDRRNCPFTGDRMAQLEAVCNRARVIKSLLDPEPEPDPDPDPDPTCAEELEAALGYAEKLEKERAVMLGVIDRIGKLIDPYRDGDEEA